MYIKAINTPAFQLLASPQANSSSLQSTPVAWIVYDDDPI